MRKMKKVLSLAMTAAMTASLLTGMGAVTASAKKSDDGKRTKITALLKGTESTEQYKTFDYLLKNFCDEKGLDYEIELVNDMQDYFTKLQMYINSDTLPDIFGCPNGTLSKACKDIDALVNVGDELERNGYDEKLNGAIRDFLTDADDGICISSHRDCTVSILCTEKISLKKQESKMLRQHGKNLKKIARKLQIRARFRLLWEVLMHGS